MGEEGSRVGREAFVYASSNQMVPSRSCFVSSISEETTVIKRST